MLSRHRAVNILFPVSAIRRMCSILSPAVCRASRLRSLLHFPTMACPIWPCLVRIYEIGVNARVAPTIPSIGPRGLALACFVFSRYFPIGLNSRSGGDAGTCYIPFSRNGGRLSG